MVVTPCIAVLDHPRAARDRRRRNDAVRVGEPTGIHPTPRVGFLDLKTEKVIAAWIGHGLFPQPNRGLGIGSIPPVECRGFLRWKVAGISRRRLRQIPIFGSVYEDSERYLLLTWDILRCATATPCTACLVDGNRRCIVRIGRESRPRIGIVAQRIGKASRK